MIKNSPFSDACVKKIPTGSASTAPHMPSKSGNPLTNSPFADAIGSAPSGSRTGGLLPETQMDKGFSHKTPSVPAGPDIGKQG